MNIKSLFNIGSRLFQYYLFHKRIPLTVSYLTTYRCNQHCRYCDWGKMGGRELETEEAIRLIQSLSGQGVVKLGFAGGESLCRDDINVLLEVAHKSGLIISISSNGKAIGDHIDAILKYVDVVQLSLDGKKETHDALRGENTYEHVIQAIKMLRGKGQKLITNTVMTKQNLADFPFILDQAEKYGYRALFQPVFEYKISADEDVIQSLRPSLDEMRTTVEYLIQQKRHGRPVGNSVAFFRYIQKTWDRQQTVKCHANDLFCTIDPVGNVLPCCFDVAQDERFNAAKLGFAEAFSKARANTFSRHCQGCYCNAYIESNLAFCFHMSACFNALDIV